MSFCVQLSKAAALSLVLVCSVSDFFRFHVLQHMRPDHCLHLSHCQQWIEHFSRSPLGNDQGACSSNEDSACTHGCKICHNLRMDSCKDGQMMMSHKLLKKISESSLASPQAGYTLVHEHVDVDVHVHLVCCST